MLGAENNMIGNPVIVFENGRGTSVEYWIPIMKELSKENQIDSRYKTYDKYADDIIAKGSKFIAEEMKAQREFAKTGYELCNQNPLPDASTFYNGREISQKSGTNSKFV